ncbi:site-specific integrase [Sciscionella marina]|uniref:site-specific integrase n=1 Tax=Sciscionella marina TaxID=508770 RepID=UPI0003A3C663|nr:site-specific integrase [Sciscionella marina]
MEGVIPRGRRLPLWWTLRKPVRPLTYHAAHRMFERVNDQAGTAATLHALRHTAAYRMAEDPSLPLTDVQLVLGHAQLTTTQLYLTPRKEEVIRKLVESREIPLRERVVGLLVLLYAQPVSRIALLRTDDLILEEATILLRIGDPPTPVPEPLAGLLRELRAQRMAFQGPNADTPWLFPGRRAGQPMRSQPLGELLRHYGVAVQPGRTSALR